MKQNLIPEQRVLEEVIKSISEGIDINAEDYQAAKFPDQGPWR